MYINKIYCLLLILISVLLFQTVDAQTIKKNGKPKRVRHYALVLYAGGGVATYTSNIINQGEQISKHPTNLDATIRVMWHPNHRLRVGFETGYTNFYSYAIKNGNNIGKVTLSAMPILVVWSIPIIKRVNLFAGFGSYHLTTHLNYQGKVNSSTYSLGSNLAINYIQPITKKLGVAAELKWTNAFQTKDNLVGLQAQLVWKFLEY